MSISYIPAQNNRDVGPSTVPFPRSSEVSLVTDDHGRPQFESMRRSSALEVQELVYGSGEKDSEALRSALERLYETDAVYENPLVTADGRSIISEIYALTRVCSDVAVPRPLAMLSVLFGRKNRMEPWVKVLRVWSEVVEVCESESWDGNRTAVLEQILHVLLLPDLHTAAGQPSNTSTDTLVPAPRDSGSTVSLFSTAPTLPSIRPLPRIHLPIPGMRAVALPSPLHVQFRILTKLTFNERGRIAHHRDFWDIRDIAEFAIPGARAAGWLARRATGLFLATASAVFRLAPYPPSLAQSFFPTPTGPPSPTLMRTSLPLSRSELFALSAMSQAPEVDQDSLSQ